MGPNHTAPLTTAKRLGGSHNTYHIYKRREKKTRDWAPNPAVYGKRQFKPYPSEARSIGHFGNARPNRGNAPEVPATYRIDVRLPIGFDFAYMLLLLLSQGIAPADVNSYIRKIPLTPHRRISRNRLRKA